MKWISSAEIFNMASPLSFLELKKQVLVDLGVIQVCVPSMWALKAILRAKLKFNNQLLPVWIMSGTWSTQL